MPEHAEFDEDGFLTNPKYWTTEIAERIAHAYGIHRLTIGQWKIVETLRLHYAKNALLPPSQHDPLPNSMEQNTIEEEFRDVREAWRIAGLPNPDDESVSEILPASPG